ncbi:MAG: hydrogenase [Acidobacteria bacterium CG_4_9_14_3_um_filter_49_7]|nr:MAG: hydrogenase [Acidobacteria bacterium CG_4_9_14_3_um_filter_49_7]
MLRIIKTRFSQKYRTMSFPNGPAPELPERFAGRPVISDNCVSGCNNCQSNCPTGAITFSNENECPAIDTGKCIFCRACQTACPSNNIQFGPDYRLAAISRNNLIISNNPPVPENIRHRLAAKLFSRSLKLRQVSAGGCNACEADSNVLGTPAWDMGRLGIQFVASPRHADGLLITGPVTQNMKLALEKTYAAVPSPKIVIAIGTCAISGGIYCDHPEQCNGAESILPVDLFIPGCPPHPLTIFDGLLRFLGRL